MCRFLLSLILGVAGLARATLLKAELLAAVGFQPKRQHGCHLITNGLTHLGLSLRNRVAAAIAEPPRRPCTST